MDDSLSLSLTLDFLPTSAEATSYPGQTQLQVFGLYPLKLL